MKIAICRYGAGNVRSVELAFRRLGADVVAADAPADVLDADLAVLPGVGSAGSAMAGLRERGLDDALRERAAAGRATLGICLGLQIALDESEEDGGTPGLGLVAGPRGAAARGARAAHRLGDRRPGRRGVLVRALVRGGDGRGNRDERGLRRRRRGRRVHRRAVPSREERRRGRALPGAMPLPRLIPCLDVAGGRVVKGVKFRELRDVGDPVELGAAYSDAGADELVFLDVAATVESRGSAVEVAARVAEHVSIPFTVGGGIRSVEDAAAVLEAGADKISVNSAALARPALIGELARTLGSQAVVVAIDTEAGRVHSHSATRDAERDTVAWARECEELGAGELLVTSIDRDGTQNGYDLELLGALRDAVSLPVIASGGAGGAQHIAAALEVSQAALLASILHEQPARLVSLREELRSLGVQLRDAA